MDKLNKSISNATNINELRQELESYLKKEYDELSLYSGDQITFHIDYISYIDDNILETDTDYPYDIAWAGIARKVQLYDINTGEKLPSTIEEVFDINDKNKEAFLALLRPHMESTLRESYGYDDYKDTRIAQYSRYLHDCLSNVPFQFFLGLYGIAFEWDTSKLRVEVPYDDLDEIRDYIDTILPNILKSNYKHSLRLKLAFG